MKEKLSVEILIKEAKKFAQKESKLYFPELYGITDGKAVGTYIEHKFRDYLKKNYLFFEGSSAKGIDFPELLVDLKVTSIRQPQSSCPFKSARQKIYGLGYSLLIFVYEKSDYEENKTCRLKIKHSVFIDKHRTADYQTTKGIIEILNNNGNLDDILAFFEDRMLPADEIQAKKIAKEIILNPPSLGFLTISNALQWRLQYTRVIQKAGEISGIHKII
ncbi:MAG: restriction endonuclease [Candidatus Cloacimonas sp. 4484_275]|nr:MAG: restriction endonuclease [Candidatus Cloacimonas sp. 4484_275]